MGDRNMRIVYSSKFDGLAECNTSFDRGILRVCYVGQNRNNSFIGKETFERCMKSIYNCPIVCRYDRELNEIGAHDMEVVTDHEGVPTLINVTTPVGVVPADARYWWEEVEEDDGSIHEYLFVDALLWKRQEAYSKIKEDGITDESMEITIKEGYMRDGVYVIDDFEFTAFCLLGTAEPCFESAALMMFSHEEFQEKLSEMMRDFKESFSLEQPSTEVVIESCSEGGKEALDEKMTLMSQYGLTVEMLDFNIEEYTIDELKEKFEAMVQEPEAEPEVVETSVEEEQPIEDTEGEQFALASHLVDELIEAISSEKYESVFGEFDRYWYTDHDQELMEVYCYDSQDWKLYGFTYSMNGDHAVIDFNSKKRMKYVIAEYDEGEQPSVLENVFGLVSGQYAELKSNSEAMSVEYSAASEKILSMESELVDLRQYKADIELAAVEKAKEELFAKFGDLEGSEAFEALKGETKYSIDELEEKCYALRGRKQASFSMGEPKIPKLPIEKPESEDSDEPYGGIFVKYRIK